MSPVDRTPSKSKMDEVKPLIHQRGQVKAKVTAISNALEKAEDDNQVSLPLLKVYTKKLDAHYLEYNALHKEILNLIPESRIDEQDAKLNEFDNLHTECMMRLECLMEKCPKPVVSPGSQPSSSNQNQIIVQQQPLKAPIPTFDGRYESWPRFKSMFLDIVGRCSDSDAINLHHLEKSLVGDAANIIDSRTLADNNYAHAWEILEERYENPRVIVDIHIGGLLSMKRMGKESHKELRELVDTCTRHIEDLKFMEQTTDNTAGLIINKVLISCLDPNTRKLWERTLAHGELPNLDDTLKFLKEQCQVLERCEADLSIPSKQIPAKSPQVSNKPPGAKVHTAASDSKFVSCQFCSKTHFNYQCPEFRKLSIPDRVTKVKEANLCFNCLRHGHRSVNCSSKRVCAKCSKHHHSLLHDETPKSESNVVTKTEPSHDRAMVAQNAVPISTQTPSDCVQSTTVSSSYSLTNPAVLPNVLLLTAKVNLIDCNGQFVPCRAFLDCGAQVNLLSASMFEKLGIEGKSVSVNIFGVSDTQSTSSRFVTVNMHSMYSDYRLTLNCLVTPKITGILPSKSVV